MELKEIEQQYIDAKVAYYKGEPIMSDVDFDILENKLMELNSDVTTLVGAQIENGVEKVAHPTKMLSLNKIQIDNPLFETKLKSWLSTVKSDTLVATPKYDGCGLDLLYTNGELLRAITRGNGEVGQDVTRAALNFVPRYIKSKDTLSVRGEVVIPLDVFEEKYKNVFKNPRNFVSGAVSRKTPEVDVLDDFHFIPVDVRNPNTDNTHTSLKYFIDNIWPDNYCAPDTVSIHTQDIEFNIEMLKYISDNRLEVEEDLNYLVDGIVLSAHVNVRSSMGEKDKYPNWAIAIKLPPVEKSSIIENIEWSIGSSGEFTPVAYIEPTLIDGSEVSKISMYNLEWVEKSGCSIGTKVLFRKSGDIIPKITEVMKQGNGDLNIPETCPYCNHTLSKPENKKLVCENDDCSGQSSKKLSKAIKSLELYHIGDAMIDKLKLAGVSNVMNLFRVSEQQLIDSGEFKSGRLLERMLDEIYKPKKFKLWQVINALQFDLVGRTVSKKIAKVYCDIDVDWKGIDYVLRDRFSSKSNTNSNEWLLISKFISILEDIGHTIIYPEKPSEGTQYIEMTGSPKSFGFKTKNDFLEQAKSHGFEKSTLTNADYLVTDDLNSSSSKMSKARKKGIEIVTYDQLF